MKKLWERLQGAQAKPATQTRVTIFDAVGAQLDAIGAMLGVTSRTRGWEGVRDEAFRLNSLRQLLDQIVCPQEVELLQQLYSITGMRPQLDDGMPTDAYNVEAFKTRVRKRCKTWIKEHKL